MFTFLKGYRTYLCALGVGVVAVLQYLGFVDAHLATLLYGLLGGSGVAALRAAQP